MSKAVRWQVPFAAHDGTRYRVDIYDEGYTGNPVVLTAGETPFTTDEDDSDDFFAPVRTQTGTLQVCTDIEGSNTPLKLEDILPANNIARPVRLLKYANGSYSVIEWQGFLSCEAYSQDYIGIPQNLDLPLIGVLEAMASVEVDPAKLSGLNTVGGTINQLLEIFIEKAGVSYFSEYYVPTIARGRNIVSKYIDATILFEQKEYDNENSTTYIVSGLSLQDCLARIATYMGWCLREKSGTLYFMAANETVSYNRRYRQGVAGMQGNFSYRWMMDQTDTVVSTQDIDDLDWMGNGHQRSVAQGAKSVEVVAKLIDIKPDINIPESPVGDTTDYSTFFYLNPTVGGGQTILSMCNRNATFSNKCTFAAYKMNSQTRFGSVATPDDVIGTSLLNPNSSVQPKTYLDGTSLGMSKEYAGAFMARLKASTEDEYKSGIYILGMPQEYNLNQATADNYMFEMRSLLDYTLTKGTITINGSTRHFWGSSELGGRGGGLGLENMLNLTAALSIGDKYWNGSSWVSSFATFNLNTLNIQESTYDKYSIPINSTIRGEIKLKIYADIYHGGLTYYYYTDMFLYDIQINYEKTNDDTLSDRSENHYSRLLGTNFRDEISIGTELASMLNNQPSPSLIMNDQTTPMTMLNYGSTQSPDMRRPEADLLNRLATYYGAARQRLELEVAHITTPLPMLRLNGIDDGKVYLPLAESRDWRTGVCKLTCIESPQ